MTVARTRLPNRRVSETFSFECGGFQYVATIILGRMKAFITTNRIDVFMIDPLISFHAVSENSNSDMDLVIKEGLGAVAAATNSAGEIFHHPGKPKPGQETTVDDGRGASAIIWAVRSARVLNFMTPEDAKKLGIAEELRPLHVRIRNGKANVGPLGSARWLKIEIENLPNGDQVACATSWKPPGPFQGMTMNDIKVAREVARHLRHPPIGVARWRWCSEPPPHGVDLAPRSRGWTRPSGTVGVPFLTQGRPSIRPLADT